MAKSVYCALALVALSGCPTTECPSGSVMFEGRCVEADTGTPGIDASTDAASGTDANTDAFSVFDAWAPDAGTDAFMPDAFIVPDATMCNPACSGERDICISMNVCGECQSDADCDGATPACNTATNTCVPCTATNVTGCPSGMEACTDDNRCVQCTAGSAGACVAPTPVCDTSATSTRVNQCVGCVSATDCMGATPACNTTSQTCAICTATDRGACTTAAQPACEVVGATATCTCTETSCTSATASRCNVGTNACEGCMGPGDCSNVSGTRQCINPGAGTGRCVACTVATEATDCPGSFCFPPGHPMANTCSGLPTRNITQCNTCIADAQCPVGSMCGMDRLTGGQRCLPVAAAVPPPCPRPFAELPSETNDLGVGVSYCRSATSTCAPIARFRQPAGTCTGFAALAGAALTAANADCGETGVCRFSATLGNVCTFPCTGNVDCPFGFECVADAGVPGFMARCALVVTPAGM